MDALLMALLLCLLGEMGDRPQLLGLALTIRYDRLGAVLSGIAIAAFANATISAIAGGLLATMLGNDARTLFFALALLASGVGLLMRIKAPDTLGGWRIGPFFTSALGLFILAFGNGAQFLTMAIAVRTGDPVMSALGAGLGVFLALLPVVLLRQRFFVLVPLKAIRRAGGSLLVLVGAVVGLGAIGLI